MHMMLFCDFLIVQYVDSLNVNDGLNMSDTWKAERFLHISYFSLVFRNFWVHVIHVK